MVVMTQTVTIREVNQHTSAVFARVVRGEELIVTKDGRPQARITPYRPTSTYEELVADGRIIPPAQDPTPFIPLPGEVDLDRVLAEERAEREWL